MALTEDAIARFHQAFSAVESQRLAGVRYVNLDYLREARGLNVSGARAIVDDEEWVDPTWSYVSSDSVDWGVELVTEAGSMVSISWNHPVGDLEGLVASNDPIVGGRVSLEQDVAVWDLSFRSTRWSLLLGEVIGATEFHLEEWVEGSDGYWLPHLTIPIGRHRVDVVLGEGAGADGEYVHRASTNLAVVIDEPWRLDQLA